MLVVIMGLFLLMGYELTLHGLMVRIVEEDSMAHR